MDTLRYGSRGTAVQYLQLALQRAGFSIALDGIFGARTLDAVRSFQQQNALSPDGIVGKRTWASLMPYLKGYTTHKIRAGDTFFALAERYGTTLRRILLANPTLDPRNLQIGTVVYIPFDFPLVPENVPYSSVLSEAVIEGLTVRYPFFTSAAVGRSVMGKPLCVLRCGRGGKEIFYNAAHHANEWLTTPVLLKFAEDYGDSYASGGELGGVLAAELFRAYSLYLLPMVNPDGVDLVTGLLHAGGYYNSALRLSQRYPEIPFPDGWKANIAGVDLNLQYPANWEEAKRIKYEQGFTSPAPRDFVGSAPLTAPESYAVYDFTRRHDFRLTLSYHSQGRLIYWKYLDYEPARSRQIVEFFGGVSGYAVEETPYASGFAGYKDWFIATFDRPGYTIEVGVGQNPLPLQQFPEIYRENLGILVGGMTQI